MKLGPRVPCRDGLVGNGKIGLRVAADDQSAARDRQQRPGSGAAGHCQSGADKQPACSRVRPADGDPVAAVKGSCAQCRVEVERCVAMENLACRVAKVAGQHVTERGRRARRHDNIASQTAAGQDCELQSHRSALVVERADQVGCACSGHKPGSVESVGWRLGVRRRCRRDFIRGTEQLGVGPDRC